MQFRQIVKDRNCATLLQSVAKKTSFFPSSGFSHKNISGFTCKALISAPATSCRFHSCRRVCGSFLNNPFDSLLIGTFSAPATEVNQEDFFLTRLSVISTVEEL
jgi:hypothetical protein